MDNDEIAHRLADVHGLALRLDEAGAGFDLIARVLGIDISAVGPLLDVAHRKRDRARSGEEPR